ncbi:MAG: dTMP kinase [Candidatus Altiarchaeales archaeon WOR_SM1_79]|nr:MAG: dTMP kinase [Candidatus Altiarchaeales archaeon WOR_SM1_79]
MENGKFITFEGIDGSGLTTQAGLLKGWLADKGYEVYLTKEPTSGPVGVQIKLALSKRLKVDTTTLALLFAADRMDHLHNDVLPKINEGVIVICDRYLLSSYSYQSIDNDLEWLREINSRAKKPDLTILFDVPVLISQRRMRKQRWHVELFEEADKLEKVRENYLRIAKDLREDGEVIETVDGNKPIENVRDDVIKIIESVI